MYGHQLFLPIPDLDRTSYLLVLGREPDGLERLADDGAGLPAAGCASCEARGGRLVVLDPRRTETAKVADEHHFVRPGTDALLLLAMLHVAVRGGPDAAPSYVDGLDGGRGRGRAGFTPERAARVTGVGAEEIRRLARDFAAADGAAAYGRVGVSTQPSARSASGPSSCSTSSPATSTAPGGVDVHDARRSTWWAPA